MSDGSEPHDHIYSGLLAAVRGGADYGHGVRGVPGVAVVGTRVGYTGYYPAIQIEAYLWNIKYNSVDTAV